MLLIKGKKYSKIQNLRDFIYKKSTYFQDDIN